MAEKLISDSEAMGMKLKDFGAVVLAIILCETAGTIGAVFSFHSIPTWYVTLIKPALTPPGWVFVPVWNLLYALMGISLYLVWRQGSQRPEVNGALAIFAVQLVLNALWSMLFFGLQSTLAGLVGVVVLWAAIVITIWRFNLVSRVAAWLQVPYFLWTSFAVYLNFSIWLLN